MERLKPCPTPRRHLAALGLALMLAFAPCLRAQVAGLNTLSLLKMPSSARTAALGVDFLSVHAPLDLNVGLDNPSLICADYHRRLTLNYVNLFAGSNFGSVAYGLRSKQLGTFLLGFHFNSYGSFEGYDEREVSEGRFYASDVALSVAWGLQIDSSLSIGADFKPILSQYESYTALAFALDVAGSYLSKDKRFAASLQARNIGAQIVTFDGTVERLPFNLAASCSYKAQNAPFRLYVGLDYLTRWKLRYDDPLNPDVQIDPYTGEAVAKPWYDGIATALDQLARHASLGLEVDLKHAFFVRLGYRFRQTAEMAADDRTNLNFSGFTYGFGIHTKRFDFAFARRNYHLGQAPNYLSLSFKL